jgi:small conductance mechanosensitive channel
MQDSISFTSVLPALVTLTGALAALWLAFWLAAFGLQRWAQRKAGEDRYTSLEQWIAQITRLLRRITGFASVVIATLIMLYGVGIRGFPRITWDELAAWISGSGLPLLFIVGSAFVLIRAQSMVTRSLPDILVSARAPLAERLDRRKRVETRGRLARWVMTAVVLAIAGVMTLKALGVDVTPLLTGGAIVSVALGFGAQNLVRDVIAGVFFILEDQIRVGDIATINGKGGQVEAIHLRTISLRGLDGTVHIFPNGSVNELSNMTKSFSYYVIDLGVAYKESVDRVMEVLREIGEELLNDPSYRAKILAPLEILGVDDFAASAVIIKLRIKTVPLDQWSVGRELRRRIKNTFDDAGIELPFPHLSVYFGEASKPFAHVPAERRASAVLGQ